MRYLAFSFIWFWFLLLTGTVTCAFSLPESSNYFFSFEQSTRGWEAKGTDLGEPPIEWSIEPTDEMAKSGDISLKFILANLNDAGKIWIERPFSLKPNSPYWVNVRYAFASADWGNVNLFTIITGVVQEPPETPDGLVYQGSTGNGSETDVGYVWLKKDYNFIVQSGTDGILYVVIGVWGTWETTRMYYFDNVRITFTER
jgi:hypothetical protein